MKLIAALAALVPPAKSKNDELWPYKVVELQSSGYGDKPIVTCEYFEDSYEKPIIPCANTPTIPTKIAYLVCL